MEMGFMSSHPSVPSSAKLAIALALGVAIRRFFVFGGARTPSFFSSVIAEIASRAALVRLDRLRGGGVLLSLFGAENGGLLPGPALVVPTGVVGRAR